MSGNAQPRHPTAQRLMTEALRLFAVHGIEATPIVRIEQAAGLAPGSGAFYKHFRTKDDILRAAHTDMVATEPDAELSALAGLDIATQLQLIAVGMLHTLDQRRDFVLTGLRLPPGHGLFDETEVTTQGIEWLVRWATAVGVADATTNMFRSQALVLFGAIFSFWLNEQLAASAAGIDRHQFLTAWTGIASMVIAEAHA